jgi:hypothetical protein
MRKPRAETRGALAHRLGARLLAGGDTHPVSDELLVLLGERVAIIDTLARQPPAPDVSREIAEQARYCTWLLGQAVLQGAA